MKLGKKGKAWAKARKRLKQEYLENDITSCEYCGSSFALSFHHLDRRSGGKAKHTFEATRLLCAKCHGRVHRGRDAVEFNEELKKLR